MSHSVNILRKKWVKPGLTIFVLFYLAALTFIYWAMRQPPEKFARVMSKLPAPVVFLAFPFEPLWMKARAGGLNVGDAAPDFSLSKQDKSGSVQLAALISQQPVVLVFGSYT